jgi:hypothetical protein
MSVVIVANGAGDAVNSWRNEMAQSSTHLSLVPAFLQWNTDYDLSFKKATGNE